MSSPLDGTRTTHYNCTFSCICSAECHVTTGDCSVSQSVRLGVQPRLVFVIRSYSLYGMLMSGSEHTPWRGCGSVRCHEPPSLSVACIWWQNKRPCCYPERLVAKVFIGGTVKSACAVFIICVPVA